MHPKDTSLLYMYITCTMYIHTLLCTCTWIHYCVHVHGYIISQVDKELRKLKETVTNASLQQQKLKPTKLNI